MIRDKAQSCLVSIINSVIAITSYAWSDGSVSVPAHSLSSPSTPSSRSEQGTAPSQTWANSAQMASCHGTTENNDVSMMQYHNGLGFPDYTLAYQTGMPFTPSRMSDMTPTQQYSQSNVSYCPDPVQEFDSIPCAAKAELISQLRIALSNCGLTQEEVETRMQNIDDPDGLDGITSAWWQQLDAELRSTPAPGLPHALSASGSFQIKQSPSSQYSEVPQSNPGFAYESSGTVVVTIISVVS